MATVSHIFRISRGGPLSSYGAPIGALRIARRPSDAELSVPFLAISAAAYSTQLEHQFRPGLSMPWTTRDSFPPFEHTM